MLVRISETIFRDQSSRNNVRGKARQIDIIGHSLGTLGSKAVSAIKDKVLTEFDKANQDNVVKILPSIIQPSGGNSGNSNGNSGWNMALKRKKNPRRISQHIIQELELMFALTYCIDSISSEYYFNHL